MQTFMSPAQGVHVLPHSLPLPGLPAPTGAAQGLPEPVSGMAAEALEVPGGANPAAATEGPASMALAVGHTLGDCVIQQLLTARGTTLVYRAKRTHDGQPVVIKEYAPFDIAQRHASGQVVPREPRNATVYAIGLQAFLNEARLLAGFEHASLAKVLHAWEQDGTAYLVQPFLEGVSLNKWLADLGTPPSETWLRQMLPPLLQAIGYLHAQGCWQGGLNADNILLLSDPDAGSYLEQRPRPVLLGLDAARRALAQATQDAGTLLASGGVPVELSDGAITARRGPWTDVYGLCAVLYAAVVGRAPPSPMTRLVRDDMVSARKLGRGRYSAELLGAIDAGLVVQPAQRTQTLADFQAQLDAPAAVLAAGAPTAVAVGLFDSAAGPGSAGQAGGPTAADSAQQPRRAKPLWAWPAGVGALLLLLALLGAFFRR